MRRVITFIAVFIFVSATVFAAEPIAVIIEAAGDVSVRRDGERGATALSLKSRLFAKDILYTGANGWVSLLFNDNSVVTVSADSELYLAEFAYTAREKKFNARLAKGAMRVITGEITEQNPKGFNLSTPHVSAGIRGTILNLSVANSFTEVAVLNTDKVVIVNGHEIRQSQKIIAGEGIAQISPITAEERAIILGGEPQAASAAQTPSTADDELSQKLVRAEKPVLPAVPTVGSISGNVSGDYSTGATVDGTFNIKFDIQTLAVLYADSSGTWEKKNTGIIGDGSWNATGGTGTLGDCNGHTCLKVNSWEQVDVYQDNGQSSSMIINGGVDLQVGVTSITAGSGVVNESSHLYITQDIPTTCTGGDAGCLTRSNGGVKELKLADGDKGNAEMSGSVTY